MEPIRRLSSGGSSRLVARAFLTRSQSPDNEGLVDTSTRSFPGVPPLPPCGRLCPQLLLLRNKTRLRRSISTVANTPPLPNRRSPLAPRFPAVAERWLGGGAGTNQRVARDLQEVIKQAAAPCLAMNDPRSRGAGLPCGARIGNAMQPVSDSRRDSRQDRADPATISRSRLNLDGGSRRWLCR